MNSSLTFPHQRHSGVRQVKPLVHVENLKCQSLFIHSVCAAIIDTYVLYVPRSFHSLSVSFSLSVLTLDLELVTGYLLCVSLLILILLQFVALPSAAKHTQRKTGLTVALQTNLSFCTIHMCRPWSPQCGVAIVNSV